MAQADDQRPPDWTGRTVRGRDGAKLGRLTEVFGQSADGRGGWGVVRAPRGRRTLVPLDEATLDEGRGLVLPVDRAALRSAPRAAAAAPDAATQVALRDHYSSRRTLADVQTRQHERYGGTRLSAGFFGWLVAIGVTVLLAGIVSSILAGLGSPAAARSLATAAVAVAVVVVAYYTGGYVAGRLARFDGARNGLLTWVIGVLVTMVAAIVAATSGARDDLLAQAQLPVPQTVAQLTIGNIVTFAAIVAGTLVAAMLGGRAGERYHRKVDRAGAAGG